MHYYTHNSTGIITQFSKCLQEKSLVPNCLEVVTKLSKLEFYPTNTTLEEILVVPLINLLSSASKEEAIVCLCQFISGRCYLCRVVTGSDSKCIRWVCSLFGVYTTT